MSREKEITIYDLADKLNISVATVSRALKDDPVVNKKTKKKIFDLAEELGYRSNHFARNLRNQRTETIGVIVPRLNSYFMSTVIAGIENVANNEGYNLIISQSSESELKEKMSAKTMFNNRVDGLLVSLSYDTSDLSHFEQFSRKKIPVIFFDRAEENEHFTNVLIDNKKASYEATKHLIEQGYKRIAHISGPSHLKIFKDRLNGCIEALRENNMKIDKDLVYTGDVSIEAGRKGVQHFLKLKDPPDAVFAVEDFTALGAIKESKQHKIKIPKDFGVIGFANEGFGEHISPTLSTIDQQTVQMGKESFKLLLQMMNNGDHMVLPKKVVLEPIPIFRESSVRKK